MSDTSCTDDSAPSLSSYPPAFVSLITTFIKRAEEAETRAHKALVILRAKDSQVVQLQKRMEVLEKIASRLEEVMVPPLNLPSSPQSTDGEGACHPRGAEGVAMRQGNSPRLETLYERYPTTQARRNETETQEVHNCYTRCQHLIDGLERSNCQLREALKEESQQRVKDHEQHVNTLTRVTQAVKDMTSQPQLQDNSEQAVLQTFQSMSLPETVLKEVTSVFGASGDSQGVPQFQEDNKPYTEQMSLVNKAEFRKDIKLAESIIKAVCSRLEKGMSKTKRNSSFGMVKRNSSKKVQNHKSSKSAASIYQTPRSSVTSFKSRRKPQALNLFVSTLKRQNKRLKMKCQHFCEKFRESLSLCESLQGDIMTMTKRNLEQKELKTVDQCVQTQKIFSITMMESVPLPGKVPMVGGVRSARLLQGRLDAAAQVMARQCKQIQGLRQELAVSNNTINTLRKRLSRAEATAAGKEMLDESTRKQLQDSEDKNCALAQEIHRLEDAVSQLNQQLSNQVEESNEVKQEKEDIEKRFEEMKRTMESQLQSLSSTLQARDVLNEQATSELEAKLGRLKEQFVIQISEASERLIAADSKIQELYLGIETFLKLLFSLTRGSSSDLSPSSQAQAVQMASDILQLEPGQVQTFLHSSRYDNFMVNRWIKECNRLVHNKVFAKNLGHFLLDTVLEARLC